MRRIARRALGVLTVASLIVALGASALWIAGARARPQTIEWRRFSFEALHDRTRGGSLGMSTFFGELLVSRTREDRFGGAQIRSARLWSFGKANAPDVLFVDESLPGFNAWHRTQRQNQATLGADAKLSPTGTYDVVDEWALLVPLWFVVVIALILPASWLAKRRGWMPRRDRQT
jgi:hypothetical protein